MVGWLDQGLVAGMWHRPTASAPVPSYWWPALTLCSCGLTHVTPTSPQGGDAVMGKGLRHRAEQGLTQASQLGSEDGSMAPTPASPPVCTFACAGPTGPKPGSILQDPEGRQQASMQPKDEQALGQRCPDLPRPWSRVRVGAGVGWGADPLPNCSCYSWAPTLRGAQSCVVRGALPAAAWGP